MGFTYDDLHHMEYGSWADFFETYKKIHNIIATQSTFEEPRKVESLSVL